ncbi:MAG: DUF1963 domain-containing protein [bacterium]|nr:DUF1963 domain-containing protein [bacterium]
MKFVKAVIKGKVLKVRKMLKAGEDVNQVAHEYGFNTALYSSVINRFVDMVRLLLDNGAYLDYRDHNGATPLIMAAESGNLQIVTLLLDAGADISICDNFGRTALTTAVYRNHPEVVQVLLERGEKPDAIAGPFLGTTILIHAANKGYLELVRLLLEKGSNVNMKNKSEETALTLAKQKGNSNMIELLKEFGGVESTRKVSRNKVFDKVDKVLRDIDVSGIDFSEFEDEEEAFKQKLADFFTYVIAVDSYSPTEKPIPPGSSKKGGLPHLPPGFEWPQGSKGEEYYFFAQLNISDFKKYDLNNEFPDSGMIYHFIKDGGFGKAFYSNAPIKSLSVQEYPSGLKKVYLSNIDFFEKKMEFHPNFHFKYIEMDLLPGDSISKIKKLLNVPGEIKYRRLYDHILGTPDNTYEYAHWDDSNETLVFHYDFGDGNALIVIHPTDLKKGDFTYAECLYLD